MKLSKTRSIHQFIVDVDLICARNLNYMTYEEPYEVLTAGKKYTIIDAADDEDGKLVVKVKTNDNTLEWIKSNPYFPVGFSD